jgi:predicted alpha/beta hydrolase
MSSPQIIEYCASDGVRASFRLFPTADPDAPVVICLPAMGVRGRYYSDFACLLSKSGFHVLTSDLRGIDSSSVRASRHCDFGYEEIINRDLPALVEAARRRFPSNERLLLGHSHGGQLGALYLSTHPDAARALVLIAACNVYYRGWSGLGRWRVLRTAMLLRTLGALLGYVPAGRIGFAGNEARTLVVDWSNNAFSGRYVVANSDHDYEASLSRMAKPVLAVSFELDQFAPRKSVENFICKLASSSVTHRHFAADDEALARAGHFDWAKRASAVVAAIRNWADERLSPNADPITGSEVAPTGHNLPNSRVGRLAGAAD